MKPIWHFLVDSGTLFGYKHSTLKNCVEAGADRFGLLRFGSNGMACEDAGTLVLRHKGRPQVQRQKKANWTRKKQEAFLTALAETCNVSAALRKVKMTGGGLYRLRRRSAEFRAEWEQALSEG